MMWSYNVVSGWLKLGTRRIEDVGLARQIEIVLNRELPDGRPRRRKAKHGTKKDS